MSRETRTVTILKCDECGNEIVLQYVRLKAFSEEKAGWWHADLHVDCVFPWTMKMHKGEHKTTRATSESAVSS